MGRGAARQDNIRANSVHPGIMPPMRTSGRTADPAVRAERIRIIPMRRPGEVDEVAYTRAGRYCRANLRSPSRSASATDRLLKNQNALEKIVIIFDHPRRAWSWANVREPRRNFAVRNPWTQEP